MVIPFFPCSSTCVTGQAGSGKTRFVFQLLKTVKDMYVEDPSNVVFNAMVLDFVARGKMFSVMITTVTSLGK
jgi:excinuclease UvrABC ATPase subunit